jgi:hypothetical protein
MSAVMHLFHFAANSCGTKTGFLPSLYDNIDCPGNNIQIHALSDVLILAANVVRILIAVSGALAVIFLIVGGIYFIVSAGDPGRVKTGKDIISNSIVGLIVVLVAYAVVTFIAKGF